MNSSNVIERFGMTSNCILTLWIFYFLSKKCRLHWTTTLSVFFCSAILFAPTVIVGFKMLRKKKLCAMWNASSINQSIKLHMDCCNFFIFALEHRCLNYNSNMCISTSSSTWLFHWPKTYAISISMLQRIARALNEETNDQQTFTMLFVCNAVTNFHILLPNKLNSIDRICLSHWHFKQAFNRPT